MHAAQTCNLARLLSDTARLWPDRTALIQGEQRWTWAQIDARVDALVAALRSLGLKKGDRILLQSRNNLAMFESGWAAFRMGCVWVPTNFRLAPSEVAYLAASSGAVTMLVEPLFAGGQVSCAGACAAGLDRRSAGRRAVLRGPGRTAPGRCACRGHREP